MYSGLCNVLWWKTKLKFENKNRRSTRLGEVGAMENRRLENDAGFVDFAYFPGNPSQQKRRTSKFTYCVHSNCSSAPSDRILLIIYNCILHASEI